ncbi:hypothetical protein EDEG_04111 [Edhazardia aedis USNM 41457]|uniref:Uncharacterized protein n=1 Tax=Edhazardia aedis (strain USNM 41457) TaxID=1003232 RepID=J9DRH8_EDHAE|nr:hypothetical protein EDEG_04111 [Edhazardia aedis USNM 41457]|eukprot:EJW05170.1 hypothetical protein EDEG_04111 [Edhazardia aedis USNM 41457]
MSFKSICQSRNIINTTLLAGNGFAIIFCPKRYIFLVIPFFICIFGYKKNINKIRSSLSCFIFIFLVICTDMMLTKKSFPEVIGIVKYSKNTTAYKFEKKVQRKKDQKIRVLFYLQISRHKKMKPRKKQMKFTVLSMKQNCKVLK